jgi:uncharacterized protein with von Willebrand factor type A (vWA) domain
MNPQDILNIHTENVCRPKDINCNMALKRMLPMNAFVDKISRKMSIRGCKVSFSEIEDGLHAMQAVGQDMQSFDDVKSVLRTALSKSSECDKIFDNAWMELLTPERLVDNKQVLDIDIPEHLKPIIENHIGNILTQANSIEEIVVTSAELKKLIEQGKPDVGEGKSESSGGKPQLGGSSGGSGYIDQLVKKCSENMQSGEINGARQCMADLNKEIKNRENEAFKSKKLSEITKLGKDVDTIIDGLSKGINHATDIPNDVAAKLKEFTKEMTKLKEVLKKAVEKGVEGIPIDPQIEGGEEAQFINDFMKGGIDLWGAPKFVGAVTKLGTFQSRLREGLKELKSKKGMDMRVREKGKIIEAQYTIRQGMRKGILLDTFYKVRPPKQKESIIWLMDVSGSMECAFAFIQPIVDTMDSLGIKQRFFVGAEEGLEVKPHSNFDNTIKQLTKHGTTLSTAFDDIKPKVGTFNDKTFIVYSDMELFESDPVRFKDRLDKVVSEGGKVLLLNKTKKPLDEKYVKGVINRDAIVEFTGVDNFDRLIHVLKDSAPIIKRK